MMCARCDMRILPGEPVDQEDIVGASGPGGTVYLHRELCRRTPQPTAPSGRGARE